MQTVIAGIIEINKLFFNHRIHTCHCIKVYDRYSPYISCLLNSLHISIYIFSATILIAFIRLDILIAEVSQRTMQRSQQNDLLIREKFLPVVKQHIEDQITSFESYVPGEVAKLKDAVVRTVGRYVAVCVSDDSAAAEKILDKYMK